MSRILLETPVSVAFDPRGSVVRVVDTAGQCAAELSSGKDHDDRRLQSLMSEALANDLARQLNEIHGTLANVAARHHPGPSFSWRVGIEGEEALPGRYVQDWHAVVRLVHETEGEVARAEAPVSASTYAEDEETAMALVTGILRRRRAAERASVGAVGPGRVATPPGDSMARAESNRPGRL